MFRIEAAGICEQELVFITWTRFELLSCFGQLSVILQLISRKVYEIVTKPHCASYL
jgi:hypothetical protein